MVVPACLNRKKWDLSATIEIAVNRGLRRMRGHYGYGRCNFNLLKGLLRQLRVATIGILRRLCLQKVEAAKFDNSAMVAVLLR